MVVTPAGAGRFAALVGVTQQERGPLEWLRDRWGGQIHIHKSGFSRRPCWRLALSTQQAAVLCADVLPYLQVKQEQAANLIEFAASRRRSGGRAPASVTEIATWVAFVERSRALNNRDAIGG
jgi:hypothetical protein